MVSERPSDSDIDRAIRDNLRTTHYSDVLAARGITTVAANDAGHLVQRNPDGTSTVIGRLSS